MADQHMPNLTQSWVGFACLGLFLLAYVLVIFEEAIDLRKSKPVLVAAGLIWALIGWAYVGLGKSEVAEAAAQHIIFEYGELFLFLLVAITYVNTLEERRVFDALRVRLTGYGLSYRQLFWITGALAFFLSGVLDNLTTALVMGAVVLAVGRASPGFVAISCISIVVAANAGGAFTPFGDITTLMVWQKGKVAFLEFFVLFVPSLVNWLVPATILQFRVPAGKPSPSADSVAMKPGAIGVMVLFAITIVTAVLFRNVLGLQPALGMMLGLGLLQVWAYYLQRTAKRRSNSEMVLNSFKQIERVEWDTLLFFFGIIFSVGGLGVLGYLTSANTYLYGQFGPTVANITIGILSAIVDNIPLMFAVLTMDPAMSHGQWLLITLTAGVGGSILAIGSAAGVAMMGLAPKQYTFMSHLKWSWAVALGYGAAIVTHLLLNQNFF
jgi:Na+/H+ antiporter NhaD/arsenite permease-like protein